MHTKKSKALAIKAIPCLLLYDTSHFRKRFSSSDFLCVDLELPYGYSNKMLSQRDTSEDFNNYELYPLTALIWMIHSRDISKHIYSLHSGICGRAIWNSPSRVPFRWNASRGHALPTKWEQLVHRSRFRPVPRKSPETQLVQPTVPPQDRTTQPVCLAVSQGPDTASLKGRWML